jgi:hypothetical protein
MASRFSGNGGEVKKNALTSEPLPLMGPGTFELDADISALGMAFIEVLKLRQSQRDFSERELSWYRLSRLLWAADMIRLHRPCAN